MPALTKPNPNAKRLFLLDAYALIFRAHFAFIRNPLINSKGLNVSAITGFMNNLWDIISNEKPTHLGVAFDVGQTDRAAEYEFYKANRPDSPEDIKLAVPYIHRILKAMNIPAPGVAGFEADDLIGTLAKQAEQQGYEVYMVTPDKDYGQLVSDKVFMYKPASGFSKAELLGVNEILTKWDISRVDQVIDMLGLMGDSADNIPGIKGVGEKTAIKLLKEFDNIENLLANTHLLSGKTREQVEAGREMALASKKLATIICDAPITFNPDDYAINEIDKTALSAVFAELEFRTLGKRILGDDYALNTAKATAAKNPPMQQQNPEKNTTSTTTTTTQLDLFSQPAATQQPALPQTGSTALFEEKIEHGRTIANTPHEYQLADTPQKRALLISELLLQKLVAFDTETTGIDANNSELVGLSFSWQATKGWYVPIPPEQDAAKAIVAEFKPFFEAQNIIKIGQNIKYDLLMLRWYAMEVQGVLEDTMVAHYLLEPEMRHGMDYLAETYLGYTPVSIETLIGKKGAKQLSMRQVAVERVAEYAAEDADITLQLHQKFAPLVHAPHQQKLFAQVEMPLVRVLTNMEFEGVKVDVDFLNKYSTVLTDEIEILRIKIYSEAGVSFNLESPRQLGEVLFDRMKIPYEGQKTKTGQYSTNEETLSALAFKYPIAATLLDYRELTKLRSTYVDALPQLINPRTGRIHTTYQQTVAATGRLSSQYPNLQNIPIRTERGREIRKAFIPRASEFTLLSADYSQIELRLMAALSHDQNMLDAFMQGLDIHTATAARVFGVALDSVDKDMRRKAKMVNFGIIYGISAFGLAQRLGVPRSEAKQIIDEYFKSYPRIKGFMDECVASARTNGYTQTILGRRRYLKDISSKNPTIRNFAERTAINSPIQGSAADLIKVAMVNINIEMEKRNLESRMILQVHDELVFDVYNPEIAEMQDIVKTHMEQAIPDLAVPIKAETGTGKNWLEAH